ncbi:MAG TPA: hypothetical protein VHY32_01675 [Caulobacteraceae bacterium]|nr:hypothetical protein [Caulobacteraceae bacterium]
MSITWYAPLVILVGLGLWLGGDVLGSVVALLFFSLFGGGAAFVLGTTSIQPTSLFQIFLLAHLLLSMFTRTSHVNIGLKTNGYLMFYSIYGAVTAFILPRIFARSMALPPMLINNSDTYYVSALGFSRQNITTAIYMMGTLAASICAGAATADPKSRRVIVNWSILIAWAHVGFGVLGVIATKAGGSAIISFFRNAKYAELNEQTVGFVRMDGIFPEPSSYGAYAFVWFVFMVELWLRQIKPIWTGLTAAALLAVLLACTSTTAYFSLAAYAGVMLARWVIAPGGLQLRKLAVLGFGGLSVICLVLALVAFVPSIAGLLSRALASMTVHKLDSTSGLQRAFWVKAGVVAFVKSHGLGVGAGSFRCSSLIFAILGATGVVGTAAFACVVLNILQPLRAKTYDLSSASRDAVGASAAWAACAGLFPALVSLPSPDPGVLFGVFGGLALGWGYLAEKSRPASPLPALFARRGEVGSPEVAAI